MLEAKRVNNFGLSYTITKVFGPVPQANIKLDIRDKEIIVNASIEDITNGWDSWRKGMLIQYAFSFLNREEREFIMTGITPKEWNEMFKNANK